MRLISARSLYALLLLALVVGCGDGSSGNSGDGKWLEAPRALTLYLADADLVLSGRDKEGCPVVIERIRKALNEGASNFGTQEVLGVCSGTGMEFGDQVRCHGKRLQVRCK